MAPHAAHLPEARDLSFVNARGLRIFCQLYAPAGDPRAVIVIVHGYGEHQGRYGHVVEHLLNQGYAVALIDHQGHGRSEGQRAYIDSLFHFTDDLRQLVEAVRRLYPDRPLFLLGHSMGALITLVYVIRHPDGLTGMIVSGSPVLPDANVPPIMVQIGQILNRIVPTLPLLTPAPTSAISRDPAVVRDFDADPLNYHGKLRVRLGMGISEGAQFVRAHFDRLTLPSLYLHGTADPFVTVEGTKLVYERAAAADKTMKLYDGLYHEILNEAERGQVLADISAWLDAHLPPRPAAETGGG
jgi:alpha-beta hydrolase superfamily lysophospholipase